MEPKKITNHRLSWTIQHKCFPKSLVSLSNSSIDPPIACSANLRTQAAGGAGCGQPLVDPIYNIYLSRRLYSNSCFDVLVELGHLSVWKVDTTSLPRYSAVLQSVAFGWSQQQPCSSLPAYLQLATVAASSRI